MFIINKVKMPAILHCLVSTTTQCALQQMLSVLEVHPMEIKLKFANPLFMS